MWILHRSNNMKIVNINQFDSIEVRDSALVCKTDIGGDEELKVRLEYSTPQEAGQSWGYMLEAIKSKEKLARI